MKPLLDFEILDYEAINFDLDRPGRPDNLIYHFTRQARGPALRIRTVDRLGFVATLVRKGQLFCKRRGTVRKLGYGSFFLGYRNDPYESWKEDPEPLEITNICFDPAIKPMWDALLGPETVAIEPRHPEGLVSLVDRFFDQLRLIPDRRIERANSFAPFLLELLAAENAMHRLSRTPDERLYLECLQYMRAHGKTLRSVDEVAAACHISRWKLYTLFQAFSDDSPKAVLREQKAAHAMALLAETGWTTERIAGELGYADAPSFTKAFARTTGLPPGQWRKTARQP